MKKKEVFDLLTREYSLVLATTTEEIEAVKEIREKVFSPKLSLSKQELNEKGFIFNKGDNQSLIFLLKNKKSGKYCGTIRVFFVNNTTEIKQIPMLEYGEVELYKKLQISYPICEISRLALVSDLAPYQDFSALKLRTYLSIGLMSTIGISVFLYKLNQIFSIMEPALDRILSRQGIYFNDIGPNVELYGKRAPYMIKRENLILESEEILGEITMYYLKEMCKNPEKLWYFVDNNPYLTRKDIEIERLCKLFKKYGDEIDIPRLLNG